MPEEKQEPTACPKCGGPFPGKYEPCPQCGIIYEKYVARQERLARGEEERPAASPAAQAPDADAWLEGKLMMAGILLLLGFILPLAKHSLLFGGNKAVWPWTLWGKLSPGLAAALGEGAFAPHPALWSLLPLLVGAAALYLAKAVQKDLRDPLATATGFFALFLFFVLFYREFSILGLSFTPPSAGAGIFMLAVILAFSMAAASNHARKGFPDNGRLRILSGAGGAVGLAAVVLALLASSGPWKAWPMVLLFLILGCYALCALVAAFSRSAGPGLLLLSSLVARAALCWAPLALVVAQRVGGGGYERYVLEGGGSVFSLTLSAAKFLLIAYGAGILLTAGMAGLLARRLEQQ